MNKLLPITYYLLPITYYLLPITYYLLPITYYLFMATQKKVSGKKPKTPAQEKIEIVMHEFKEGELHSGNSDVIVTDRKQAIAIALSEAHQLEIETKHGKTEKNGK